MLLLWIPVYPKNIKKRGGAKTCGRVCRVGNASVLLFWQLAKPELMLLVPVLGAGEPSLGCQIPQNQSGRQDSNLRPLHPQCSALAKLRHAPNFRVTSKGR